MARPRRGQLRSPRRSTAWGTGVGSTAPTTINGTQTSIIGGSIVPGVDGLTIIRIRGYIELVMDAIAAAQDGFTGAFGICLVTTDAFAVGITAMPDPVGDAHWDGWFYHRFFSFHAAAGAVSNELRLAWELDSKAMRKFPAGMNAVLLLETTEIGTASMEVFADSRTLVKLP